MKKLAVIVAVLAVVAAPASAGLPQHPSQLPQLHKVSLSFRTSKQPETFRSQRFGPNSNVSGEKVQATARFNGHFPQSCWSDTQQQFECAWRGVIVVIQTTKRAGPMVVHVASTRNDPVKVRLALWWR